MITLITGVPGSGKSLLAVQMLLENAQSESPRPAFSNIEGLDYQALACFPLDNALTWYDLPEGSLIVIDECQRFFPPRPSGSKVPEFISQMETHRHKGHDLVLITQGPKLVDQNVRTLTGRHLHMYRPFGIKRRTVFEWNAVNENPEPAKNDANALTKKLPFDESLFKYYTSAVQHTHGARLPVKKLAVLGCSLLLVVLLGGFVVTRLLAGQPEQPAIVQADQSAAVPPSPSTDKSFLAGGFPEDDEKSWTYAGRIGGVVYVRDPRGSSVPLTLFNFEIHGAGVHLYAGREVFAVIHDARLVAALSRGFR